MISDAAVLAQRTAHPDAAAPRRRAKTWVVLPAFNEAAGLPSLLTSVDEAMLEADLRYAIVLVDDGSRDGTAEIARAHAEHLPLLIETHERNLGLGATIRDGLVKAASLAHPKDTVVTMDADNSHPPELILRMVRLVREGHDVVVASRYQAGSQVRGVPLSRRLLSYGASRLFRLLFPTPGLRDYTSGFRAYRASLLQRVIADQGPQFFEQQGFSCMVDILLKLRPLAPVIGEVPIVLRYDHKQGPSKMKVARTTLDTLALLLRRRLRRS
jgi:dolichol-phosphate mannosyltransferase